MKKILSIFALAVASFAAVAGAGVPVLVAEEKPLVFNSLDTAVRVAGRLAVATAEKFGTTPRQVVACGAEGSNTIVVRASSLGNESFATIMQTGDTTFTVERGAKRDALGDKCFVLDKAMLGGKS